MVRLIRSPRTSICILTSHKTNQVAAARELGIPTETINGNTSHAEKKRIYTDINCGHPKTRLLYVTPELCATNNFRDHLAKIHQQGQLVRIAIDEAHCISEWGHDFRPAYKELSWLKQRLILPSVPIIALTATATPKVRDDIIRCLRLEPLVYFTQYPELSRASGKFPTKYFSTPTARPNIHYEVQYFSESAPKDSSGDVLFAYLKTWLTSTSTRRTHRLTYLARTANPTLHPTDLVPITGIIYVPTRNLTTALATKLRAASISSLAYHAGLDPPDRLSIQASFIRPPVPDLPRALTLSGSFNIIVATTAFGMGIDCPGVRFVVHYGMPRGLESFVQESGRAGRDGKAASSLVLYTREERDRATYRVQQDVAREARAVKGGANKMSEGTQRVQAQSRMQSLQCIIDYCENTGRCKHEIISEYFGDGEKPVCDYACDFCKEGTVKLSRRKERGLATEEMAFEFTQRERGEYESTQQQQQYGEGRNRGKQLGGYDPFEYWEERSQIS